MSILHLGVTDIPYTSQPATATLRKKRTAAKAASVSTGDVAGFLEDKYHVMEHFYEAHGQEIGDALTEALKDSLENLMLGAPLMSNPFAGGEAIVETLFRKTIDNKELDNLGYPGIPTRASIEGISHRLKSARRPGRPSFQDTGLYEASFKAWVD